MKRNPTAPTVAIDLDKRRHLCLDFNAIASVEEKTNRNLLKKEGWSDLGARDLRAIIWACLLSEDDTLTIEQVGAMIHPGNMSVISEKISELLTATNGKGGSDDTERPTTKGRNS